MCHRQRGQRKERMLYTEWSIWSFESLSGGEGAVSGNQGLDGGVQRAGCAKPALCVTQQESERRSLVKATS